MKGLPIMKKMLLLAGLVVILVPAVALAFPSGRHALSVVARVARLERNVRALAHPTYLVRDLQKSYEFAAGERRTVGSPACGKNETLLGGGFRAAPSMIVTQSSSAFVPQEGLPVSGNPAPSTVPPAAPPKIWVVEAYNPVASKRTVTVEATCLNIRSSVEVAGS